MRPSAFLILIAASLVTSCSTAHVPQPTLAPLRGPMRVEVIDRTNGAQLPVYWHAGKRWIAGKPGHRYSIVLRNATGGRLLAVVAVDGVNAVSGETASWDQTGYVLAPFRRAEIRGWRKSQDRVAAFEFTALDDSYAARTGRPENVGVIGIAVFRERAPVIPQPLAVAPNESAARDDGSGRETAQAESAGPAEPGAQADRRAKRVDPTARLGTGHGRSESSRVTYTDFERASPRPDEVITVHYDSRENLIAMGVLPRLAPTPPESPNPFPGSLGFVPDPPPR